MEIICGVGFLIVLLLCLLTIPYKKDYRKRLDKEKHKLRMIYGVAMFLTDRIPKKIWNNSSTVNSALKELSVREDIREEKYLYTVQKMAVSILLVASSFGLGFGMSVRENMKNFGTISELARDSSKTTTYEFWAEDENGQQETLVVDVEEEKLTEEEIYELFDQVKDGLVEQVLNDNESVNHVSLPLNMVSSIDGDIDITWEISDDSIVDYDGNILEDVSEDGEQVSLTATMSRDDVTMDYVFYIYVFPSTEEDSMQEQVQEYVNENNIYDEIVKLPKTIGGKSVKFFNETTRSAKWIVIIGLCCAVIVFILKDRDLKGEVKKRNKQMMADYPEIVSKMLLYYNVGLSIKISIEKIVGEYRREKEKDPTLFRYAYEELEMTLTKMNSGISEREAIKDYGSRCGLHSYIKFSGIIEQNLRRGSKDVSTSLKEELTYAMEERKHSAMKEGGEISTKLLGPMTVMLIIAIVILIVPALWEINV